MLEREEENGSFRGERERERERERETVDWRSAQHAETPLGDKYSIYCSGGVWPFDWNLAFRPEYNVLVTSIYVGASRTKWQWKHRLFQQ